MNGPLCNYQSNLLFIIVLIETQPNQPMKWNKYYYIKIWMFGNNLMFIFQKLHVHFSITYNFKTFWTKASGNFFLGLIELLGLNKFLELI